MTPHEFLTKWRNVELKERTASQSHFNDLCALLSVDDPIAADPKGEWFTFEKGASKTSGGQGWADVWRRECFAWEYKGKNKDLDKAFSQLLQYSIALESPPLLIVSDMQRFRIHTNWTNTVQVRHEFGIEDLADAATRDLLRDAFLNPEALKPAKTRQSLTEDAAKEFSTLAQRLRERNHEPQVIAHFVNRLIFCMFAEDVNLLPNKMFTRMLEHSRSTPNDFAGYAQTLFAAMKSGGAVGFERVEWFNGGLFDHDGALPLERADIDNLLTAAHLDWSEVDPSILGTLFERGLDPSKRSQLGAHYTDRDKIMQIVRPVVIAPLEAKWEEERARIKCLIENAPKETADRLLRGNELARRTKALKEAEVIHQNFLERIAMFRILDPACGSGNFLYLSLLALKDIEHRANLEAEALGLPRGFPRVGPECVLGIELNPYAAELARVSVWIGEIQWMRRNGFDAAKNPILRTLDTIECRDAVLNPDGTQAEWPVADVVTGNPPFLGNKKMIRELGEDYTFALRRAWKNVPGGVDLVCYWFAKAWAQMQAGQLQRAGLVCTNSIRGGANRDVLKPIVEYGRIFEAWSDEDWTVEGAAVRVSMVCFDRNHGGAAVLEGRPVDRVLSDLENGSTNVDLTSASRLTANLGRSFIGRQKDGPLDIDGAIARTMILEGYNPNGRSNAEIVRPWRNGMDLTRRASDKWLIDFMSMEEKEAALFELPFEFARTHLKPIRDLNRDPKRKSHWWRPGRTGEDIRQGLKGLPRFIGSPRVSKHRLFVWLHESVNPDSATVAIARDDDTTFGILHSRFHEIWSLRMGTFLGVGNDPRYTPSTTFETFPFPEGMSPNIPAHEYANDPRAVAIAAAARRLDELRENWLNPPDLVQRVPEVVAGYPDRILPISKEAAKTLAKRTLTNLYNARPTWLDSAHRAIDAAVAVAYGWGEDWQSGVLSEDEMLARLLRLNKERSTMLST